MRVRQAEVVHKSDDDELASLNAVECEGVQLRNAYPASDILSLCAHYLAKTVHAFVSFSYSHIMATAQEPRRRTAAQMKGKTEDGVGEEGEFEQADCPNGSSSAG